MYGYNDNYIKTKIKIYDNNVNTHFHGKKVPRENASYKCLSLLMLDFVVKVKKKYCPQTLLEETKKTRMEIFITDEFGPSSSDDEGDSDSDDDTDNETNNKSNNEPSNETDNG